MRTSPMRVDGAVVVSRVGQVFEPAALGEEPQGEPDLGDEGRGEHDRDAEPS